MPSSTRYTPCRKTDNGIEQGETSSKEPAMIRSREKDFDFVLVEEFDPFADPPQWKETNRIQV